MGAQTGGHSLPGGESTAGCQFMNFDSFLSTHYVQMSDVCSAGRSISNVTADFGDVVDDLGVRSLIYATTERSWAINTMCQVSGSDYGSG